MTTKEEAFTAYQQALLSEGWKSPRETFEAGWNAVIEACGGIDHVVKVTEVGWTLQHPITERLEGNLFDCDWPELIRLAVFHERLPEGVSRVWLEAGYVKWEAVE